MKSKIKLAPPRSKAQITPLPRQSKFIRNDRFYRKIKQQGANNLKNHLPSGWKLLACRNTNLESSKLVTIIIQIANYTKVEATYHLETFKYTPVTGHEVDHYILYFLLLTRAFKTLIPDNN